MEKRYRVLRLIAVILKVIAWIVLVLGVLGALGILIGGIVGGGSGVLRELGLPAMGSTIVVAVIGFISAVLFAVLYFLALYAVGEFITLVISIEENTRMAALWIESFSAPAQGAMPDAYGPGYTAQAMTPPPPPADWSPGG